MISPDNAKPEVALDLEKMSREELLEAGFIDGSSFASPDEIENALFGKKLTVVIFGKGEKKIYHGLELGEFRDHQGYGFRFPDDGRVMLVSRYRRRIQDKINNLDNWMIKFE